MKRTAGLPGRSLRIGIGIGHHALEAGAQAAFRQDRGPRGTAWSGVEVAATMRVVYFAHSYRKADAEVVDHFARLLDSEQILPSLDPPSDDVNAAKLERHLASCDGMVVVLTQREDGVSRHMLFEATMCMRARKPLLVFVEDTLPTEVVPRRVLQQRFSRRSQLRQVREQRQILGIFKDYLSERPRYQMAATRRNCLLIGMGTFRKDVREQIGDFMDYRGYEPVSLDALAGDTAVFDALHSASLVVRNIDHGTPEANETAGAARAALVPQIALTERADYPFELGLPREYQPVIVEGGAKTIGSLEYELGLFEQDFVELPDSQAVDRYKKLILDESSAPGRYGPATRDLIINNLTGNLYHADNAVAMGHNVHVENIDFVQLWQQKGRDVDLTDLSRQLETLLAAVRRQPAEVRDEPLAQTLAEASDAARANDGPKTFSLLNAAGAKALVLGKALGLDLVAKVVVDALPHMSAGEIIAAIGFVGGIIPPIL